MLRTVVASLLVGLLASALTRAEWSEAAARASEAACSAYPNLCGRELESFSISGDTDPRKSHALLRYAPHERLERERHHWQVSCTKAEPHGWSCDHLGITTTAQLSDSGDWVELLGDLSFERAQEIADFVRAEIARGLEFRSASGARHTVPPSSNIEYIIGAHDFLVALSIPGDAGVCLGLSRHEGRFVVFHVESC
jgi:hypothetical protein